MIVIREVNRSFYLYIYPIYTKLPESNPHVRHRWLRGEERKEERRRGFSDAPPSDRGPEIWGLGLEKLHLRWENLGKYMEHMGNT
jgi:hypothetical protein